MKIGFTLILAILLFSACNRSIYGKYRTDDGEEGLRELELRKNKTFDARLHLCDNSTGIILPLSKNKIVLISYFQKDSLPVQKVRNHGSYSNIILNNFPICFTNEYSDSIHSFSSCRIDSVILITPQKRIPFKDTVVTFDSDNAANQGATIVVYINVLNICSNSFYKYKIPFIKIGVDYHLVWKENYLDIPSLYDTLSYSNGKLTSGKEILVKTK